MQNFHINEYNDSPAEQPAHASLASQVDLGERIGFINCKNGLLIAYPADSDNDLDYRVPVCLGVL